MISMHLSADVLFQTEEKGGHSATKAQVTAALQTPSPPAKHQPSRSTKQTAGFKCVPPLQLPDLTGVLYWTPEKGRKRTK